MTVYERNTTDTDMYRVHTWKQKKQWCTHMETKEMMEYTHGNRRNNSVHTWKQRK